MLFEIFKIHPDSKEEFDINFFIKKLGISQEFKKYLISIEILHNDMEFKNGKLFTFKMRHKNTEQNIFFLSYYINSYDLFLINIEIYNKEIRLLLEFLNEFFFEYNYQFDIYTPFRSFLWNFLYSVNSINELKIVTKSGLIKFEEIKDDKETLLNIEKYPIYSSLISINLNNKPVSMYIYGNKFNLPNYFPFSHFDLLVEKMTPLFKKG